MIGFHFSHTPHSSFIWIWATLKRVCYPIQAQSSARGIGADLSFYRSCCLAYLCLSNQIRQPRTKALTLSLSLSFAGSVSMALLLRSIPTVSLSLSLPSLQRPSSIPRSYPSISCGPRDNRGPLLKGRILSSEAIHAIHSLKRSTSLHHPLPSLSRLLKADLLATLRELLRQDQCTLALHVLSTLRSEYPPLLLSLYADVVTALSRNGRQDEIDRLIADLDRIDGGEDGEKGLVKLLKAVIGAGRRESTVRIYGMMRNSGWGSDAWEADEYVAEVLSKGLRRLGEGELADEAANYSRRLRKKEFD